MATGLFKIENISEKHLNFIRSDEKNCKFLSTLYPIYQLKANKNNNEKVLNFIKNQDEKRNLSINSYFPEFYSLYQ